MDISKCSGQISKRDCILKNKCFRFTCKTEPRQSWIHPLYNYYTRECCMYYPKKKGWK